MSYVLGHRDAEIERGVEELIALVAGYPRDNPEMALDPADVDAFRGHYAKLLYQVPCGADASICNMHLSQRCDRAMEQSCPHVMRALTVTSKSVKTQSAPKLLESLSQRMNDTWTCFQEPHTSQDVSACQEQMA